MFPSSALKASQTDLPAAASTRMDGPLDTALVARPWLVPVMTTLAAWLVAVLVVTTLLTLFGDELASLPLALRALVMSGVLATLMANLALPVLSVAIAHGLGEPPVPRRAMSKARRAPCAS
jgi:hypothetical protein